MPRGPADSARAGRRRNPSQEQFVVESCLAGRFGATDLSELFDVSRSTVYRALRRAERAAATAAKTS